MFDVKYRRLANDVSPLSFSMRISHFKNMLEWFKSIYGFIDRLVVKSRMFIDDKILYIIGASLILAYQTLIWFYLEHDQDLKGTYIDYFLSQTILK